jgi:hypothetical protein
MGAVTMPDPSPQQGRRYNPTQGSRVEDDRKGGMPGLLSLIWDRRVQSGVVRDPVREEGSRAAITSPQDRMGRGSPYFALTSQLLCSRYGLRNVTYVLSRGR